MSAARGALAHAFEFGGDVAQAEIRFGRGEAGDERHQPVLRRSPRRAPDQFDFGEFFLRQPVDGAAQLLDRPCLAARVQHAHDVVPTVFGAQAAHERQPVGGGGDEIGEIDAPARRRSNADRFRTPFAQARITRQATAGARGLHAGLGALGDQRALELGDRAEHLQREHALRRRGVDGIAQRAEMRALRLELLDEGEQVADRAGEAVEAHDDEDVAGGDLAHELGEDGPGARGAGAVFLVDDVASGGAQFVDLGVGRLLLGGDAGVAEKANGGGAFGARHGRERAVAGWFVQYRLLLATGPLQAWRGAAGGFTLRVRAAGERRQAPDSCLQPAGIPRCGLFSLRARAVGQAGGLKFEVWRSLPRSIRSCGLS